MNSQFIVYLCTILLINTKYICNLYNYIIVFVNGDCFYIVLYT